jgi:hypothetical protein
MEATAPAEGWFSDPNVPGQLRWWDGTQWTEHVAPDPAAAPAPAPAPAAAPAPEPQPAVVAVAQPAAVAAPAAPTPDEALATTMASQGVVPTASASMSGDSSTRKLALIGGVLVLVVVLAYAGTKLLGGGDAATGPNAATVAASGPPLTAQEYAAKWQALGEDGALEQAMETKNPTPEQIRLAATELRQVIAEAKAMNPPPAIAAEHATLVTQMESMATGFDAMAVNPKDQAAGMKLLSDVLAMAATMQKIETTLGIKFESQDAAAAPA